MHSFSSDTGAALAFVILYLAIFIPLSVLYYRKSIALFSRWTFIYIHVLIRLASQICAIAFSFIGWDNTGLLVAYLVLSAEGYFSVILCSYRFMIDWDQKRRGVSFLEPRIPRGTPLLKRIEIESTCPMAVVHWVLIAANAIIVTGGSMMSSLAEEDVDPGKILSGKVMRAVGTGGFILLAQILALYTLRAYKRGPRDWSLRLILLTWPFLTVRGVFGLLNVFLPSFNYFNPEIYDENGMSTTFLLGEYLMGALMEWSACVLLVLTYWMPGEKAHRDAEKHEQNTPATKIESKVDSSQSPA